MAGSVTLTRGTTLPDSSAKADFHNLIDTATGTLSGITTADLSATAGIVDTQLATLSTAGKVNLTALVATSQAQGDVLYASSSTVWARLGAGTSGYILKTQGAGANPVWLDPTTIFNSTPAGTISMWGGAIASPPTNWLICDGSVVSQATYPALYAVIGAIYGSDAGGNFTLPNFTNKFAYGANEGASAGNASVGSAGGRTTAANDNSVTMATDTQTASYQGNGGGPQAAPAHDHDAMPPYLAVSFIIKYN